MFTTMFYSRGLIWDLWCLTNTRVQGQHKSGKNGVDLLSPCLYFKVFRSENWLWVVTSHLHWKQNTSKFWRRCLFEKIQMLCCIFPHCLRLSSLHIQTTKRFPPTVALFSPLHLTARSSVHITPRLDSSSNIYLILPWYCKFFFLFFHIYFVQIYNPKFRTLIYMETFFFFYF